MRASHPKAAAMNPRTPRSSRTALLPLPSTKSPPPPVRARQASLPDTWEPPHFSWHGRILADLMESGLDEDRARAEAARLAAGDSWSG